MTSIGATACRLFRRFNIVRGNGYFEPRRRSGRVRRAVPAPARAPTGCRVRPQRPLRCSAHRSKQPSRRVKGAPQRRHRRGCHARSGAGQPAMGSLARQEKQPHRHRVHWSDTATRTMASRFGRSVTNTRSITGSVPAERVSIGWTANKESTGSRRRKRRRPSCQSLTDRECARPTSSARSGCSAARTMQPAHLGRPPNTSATRRNRHQSLLDGKAVIQDDQAEQDHQRMHRRHRPGVNPELGEWDEVDDRSDPFVALRSIKPPPKPAQ